MITAMLKQTHTGPAQTPQGRTFGRNALNETALLQASVRGHQWLFCSRAASPTHSMIVHRLLLLRCSLCCCWLVFMFMSVDGLSFIHPRNFQDFHLYLMSKKPSCPQPFSRGFFCYFVTESHCVVQAGLKLAILLPQPPQCWDFRRTPPHLAPHESLFFDTEIWTQGLTFSRQAFLLLEPLCQPSNGSFKSDPLDWAGAGAQVVGLLISKHKTLSSNPSTTKKKKSLALSYVSPLEILY
jgi:hypothetical protein